MLSLALDVSDSEVVHVLRKGTATRGKVLKRAPQFEVATLSAEVTPRTGAPPYVRWRDWPVLGLTALGLGLLLLRRIRRHHRLGT